jgi:hypothetical protein
MKLTDILNERVSKEAMGIAGFTGTRGNAVQKFIDDYNLDARKLFNFVKKGNLKAKMEFVAAIAGKPGNMKQGKIVGMFGEAVSKSVNKNVQRLVKGTVGAVKIDLEHVEEMISEDGILEAMDHCKDAIDRLEKLHKTLKRIK